MLNCPGFIIGVNDSGHKHTQHTPNAHVHTHTHREHTHMQLHVQCHTHSVMHIHTHPCFAPRPPQSLKQLPFYIRGQPTPTQTNLGSYAPPCPTSHTCNHPPNILCNQFGSPNIVHDAKRNAKLQKYEANTQSVHKPRPMAIKHA